MYSYLQPVGVYNIPVTRYNCPKTLLGSYSLQDGSSQQTQYRWPTLSQQGRPRSKLYHTHPTHSRNQSLFRNAKVYLNVSASHGRRDTTPNKTIDIAYDSCIVHTNFDVRYTRSVRNHTIADHCFSAIRCLRTLQLRSICGRSLVNLMSPEHTSTFLAPFVDSRLSCSPAIITNGTLSFTAVHLTLI